jgi:hypothetical protein
LALVGQQPRTAWENLQAIKSIHNVHVATPLTFALS